jgi:hypothetical protein
MPVETIIDANDLRAKFAIASQILPAQLTPCVEDASRMLRKWVGAAVYEDAASETPDDEDRASALFSAETYLSMYFALLNTGARIRKDGVVKSEQDAAGPLGGNIVNQFYSPDELIKLRRQYYETAESVAADFMQATSGAGIGAATVTMQGGWRSRNNSPWDASDWEAI